MTTPHNPLTRTMMSLLGYAHRCPDGAAEIGGNAGYVRSANILARRGLLTIRKLQHGWHAIELTAAGREAYTHEPSRRLAAAVLK
jgi:hypothetical protein